MNRRKDGVPRRTNRVNISFDNAPVPKYSMTVNNMIKNAHGASISWIYGSQSEQDGGINKIRSFRKRRRKCFRWNKASGQPQEQLDVNRVDCNCYCYVSTVASTLICLYFSSVCMWLLVAVK